MAISGYRVLAFVRKCVPAPLSNMLSPGEIAAWNSEEKVAAEAAGVEKFLLGLSSERNLREKAGKQLPHALARRQGNGFFGLRIASLREAFFIGFQTFQNRSTTGNHPLRIGCFS